MNEEDKRLEDEMKRFREHMEHKYGGMSEDVLEKLDAINHELGQVIGSMVTKEVFVLEMRNLTTKTDALDKRIDDLKEALDKRIGDLKDFMKTYITVLGIVIALVGIIVPIVIAFLNGRLS